MFWELNRDEMGTLPTKLLRVALNVAMDKCSMRLADDY